ncbi:bactofilin family protein [Trichococcus paludicola]|uniref:hypothetical protein n=1 Tax=Trichococcus paludicola TaxID=2052942 RepID=UPI000D386072|nr:hypothetical protein [Trichococcus paludicola]
MKRVKKTVWWKGVFWSINLLFLAILLGFSGVASATTLNEENLDHLAAGETIEGPGFFAGNVVKVDGNVEGTTFVSGQDVRINGNINGDLFVAAQTISIKGTVTGNIYGAGQALTFDGQSESDVFFAGQNISIGQDASVGRDLFVAGATILQEGIIQRNLFGGGAEVVLSGQIGGDANLQTDSLKLQDGANIAGDLNYKGENEADIGAGATIAGDTDWEFAETMDKGTTAVRESNRPYMKFVWFLWSLASALLIWFLIRIWRPAFWQNTTRPLAEQPLKTLGVGLLTLLVVPPMIILAMVTVIGIPIALILGAVYPIALYLSRIIVAVFLGQWLANRFKWPELHKGVWLVLLGLIILGVLRMPPFIGFLSSLLIVMAGLGSLVMAYHRATPETASVQTELDL